MTEKARELAGGGLGGVIGTYEAGEAIVGDVITILDPATYEKLGADAKAAYDLYQKDPEKFKQIMADLPAEAWEAADNVASAFANEGEYYDLMGQDVDEGKHYASAAASVGVQTVSPTKVAKLAKILEKVGRKIGDLAKVAGKVDGPEVELAGANEPNVQLSEANSDLGGSGTSTGSKTDIDNAEQNLDDLEPAVGNAESLSDGEGLVDNGSVPEGNVNTTQRDVAGTSQFDDVSLESQRRQHQMLDDNEGFNVSRADAEAEFPSGTLGNPNSSIGNDGFPDAPEGGRTFITDRQAVETNVGPLPSGGGTVRISGEQARQLEVDLGMRTGDIDTGSVIREFGDLDGISPSSPTSVPNDPNFLGGGQGLPTGAPEVNISPAQPRIDNPNIRSATVIEVLE